MALQSFGFLTAKGSVRLRFDDGVSVEARGRYFTPGLDDVIGVSVSDDYLLFILDKEGDNLAAYTMTGEFAFSLSDLVPLISTVVTDDTVTFTLELTDRDGNVFEQDLSFYSPVKNQ